MMPECDVCGTYMVFNKSLRQAICPKCNPQLVEPISDAAVIPKTTTIMWHKVGEEPRDLPELEERIALKPVVESEWIQASWHGDNNWFEEWGNNRTIEPTDLWTRVVLPEVTE